MSCTNTQILNSFSVCIWFISCSVGGCVFVLGLGWFGFFRTRGIETAEEINKERGVSDTESLVFSVEFGPKTAKAQRSLLSLCIGILRETLICGPWKYNSSFFLTVFLHTVSIVQST